ncbi:unnamed protein product [Effrenium voratum]|uniref:KHDC4/BBP-like KH-domain type I domain-containing protein n=1 Tax=Effrenium voratum TaxID=2562239 RepID=A0AA36IIK2_9DINO|nr:unnamed protein product [Effrenium voratum]CAJ1424477.1 unnamed protein product [Effrenium voratum]
MNPIKLMPEIVSPGVGVPSEWTVASDWHQVAKVPMDSLCTSLISAFANRDAKGNTCNKSSNNSSPASTCDSDDGFTGGSTSDGPNDSFRLNIFGFNGAVRPPPGLEHLGPCHVPNAPGSGQSLPVKSAKPCPPGEVTLARCKKWKASKAPRYGFAATFEEFDAVTHKDFDLVQRIFGRKGINMKRISQSADSKACLMGESSGHKKQEGQLRLVVTCPSQEKEDLALRLTTELFDDLSMHFARFCRKNGLRRAGLYKIISLEEAALTFGRIR